MNKVRDGPVTSHSNGDILISAMTSPENMTGDEHAPHYEQEQHNSQSGNTRANQFAKPKGRRWTAVGSVPLGRRFAALHASPGVVKSIALTAAPCSDMRSHSRTGFESISGESSCACARVAECAAVEDTTLGARTGRADAGFFSGKRCAGLP
eukprot:6202687-Pleurochrysis_carterae.AAC.7